MSQVFCHDYGDRAGCLGTPDPNCTLVLEDESGKYGTFLFCSHCGPEAHAMYKALKEALATRGPEFREELAELISESEMKESVH